MSTEALRPAPLEPPFIGDPDKIAAAYLSLSVSEAARAANYRLWADEARTAEERKRWTAEAIRQEQGSRWHMNKYQQWRDGVNG